MHDFFLWKIKKSTTITNVFQKILDEFNCEPNEIQGHKGSVFYNRLMKSVL